MNSVEKFLTDDTISYTVSEHFPSITSFADFKEVIDTYFGKPFSKTLEVCVDADIISIEYGADERFRIRVDGEFKKRVDSPGEAIDFFKEYLTN